MRGGELRLAKTAGPLRFVWSWPDVDVTTLDPAMVIVSREPDGRWHVTFTIDTSDPEPLSPVGHAVGVDLGVKDFAVTSDGEKIANPRHLERKASNLARYQRRMARCRKGSANRAKAGAKVARAHRKVRDARRDFPAPRQHEPGPQRRHDRDRGSRGQEHGEEPQARQGHLGLWLGRVPPAARLQVRTVRTRPRSHRPLVSQLEDLLGVRAPARGAEPLDQALDVPVLPRPARPGSQRGEEHPCGRSCRSPGFPG